MANERKINPQALMGYGVDNQLMSEMKNNNKCSFISPIWK